MYRLLVKTWIDADAEVCFNLARSVEAHLESARDTGERIVSGRASGLLELGDELTFEARHLGVRQRLSSRITAMEPYAFFQDRRTKGAFEFLQHDHRFEAGSAGGTLMTDSLTFRAPFGVVGWAVERLILATHLRRFLVARGLVLKKMAERERGSPAAQVQ